MKKLHHMAAAALAASLLASLLTACGDSVIDDSTPPPVTEVPASAGDSTTAYVQYTAGLSSSEIATPLDINKVTAPTSESETPIAF